MSDEPDPTTSEQWIDWVGDRVAETDAAYLAKPDFMAGHFKGEQSTAKDYAGRELLELLQNAADAATEVGGRGRVRIEVTAKGLCVANTGQPFQPGGVRSLMTSHMSDKPERQVSLIGAKGLGFRALLNWSAEPFITSGELEIGFSRDAAERHVEGLAELSLKMRQLIGRPGPRPVPVLAFPVVGSALSQIEGSTMTPLLNRARALRTSGYDTVVVAAFASPKVRQRALSQLNEFDPHFLLFVPSLEEIVLHAEGESETRWSKRTPVDGHYVLEIESNGATTKQEWVCHHRAGMIDEPIGSDGTAKAYELAIALRRDETNASGKLHSYFSTDVPLPFPALFHATLELDSHRKSLNSGSDVNATVLDALAVFYADCLVDLVKSKTVTDPIGFLTRSGAFPEALEKLEEAVYRSAAERPLIPTMSGRRVTATETKLGPSGYGQYLPRRLFGSLAVCREDEERKTLERLKVEHFDPAQAITTLRDGKLTIAERAAVVVGFATSLPAQYHDRSLLLDPNQRPLTRQNSCFPPPASGRPPTLPRWARAKFLHPELWAKIVQGLAGQPRDRFRQLQGFGIHEFNSEGVITSLRRQAAETLKRRADPSRVKRELIDALFQLHQNVAKDAAFPQGRTEVACRDGLWRDAQSVHLSEEYGPNGRITGALYATQPQRLLAEPAANGLKPDAIGLTDFFRWIGVHEWPAAKPEPVPIPDQAQVMANLPAKVEVSDEYHRSEIARSDLRWGSNLRAEHLSLAGLEGILADAPSEAILAWLALDPRFDTLNGVPFWTQVEARSGRAAYRRYHGDLPDLVRETISSRPWLAVTDGRTVAPREAMMAPGGLARIFYAPRRSTEAEETTYGLGRILWSRGLLHAGVPGQLSDLSEAQLYRLLGSLKSREPGSDLVRRLYLQILDIGGFDATRAADAARLFRETGEVQVRKGGVTTWARPTDALYLDRDNFPAAAREYFSLIDVPPRRSATEVEARFGVAAVSKQNFSLTVSRIVEEEGVVAAQLRARLKDSLPFIKAYRLSHSVETQRIRRLEQIVLKIVVEADLEFSLGHDYFPGKLEVGKYILDGDTLIVSVDMSHGADELMLRAITAISDGLAELFELQSGDDFEKLLAAGAPSLRTLQLRRLLSNHSAEEIEQLLAGIDEEIDQPDDADAVDAETFARGAGPGQGMGPDTTARPSSPSDSGSRLSPAPAPAPQSDPATSVTSTKLEVRNETRRGGGKIAVRVASGGRAGDRGTDIHRPTDAEKWAVMFEENVGRFPIQVSRLQGRVAFGCDCLSFATEEDREAFRADPKRLKLVERFIEVKSGTVRLTENEVIAAEKHRKRYFIYRIQFEAASRVAAHLTIVADPLSHKSALARECEILVDEIPVRERYRLNPAAG